jgi:hypothetical protein
LKIFNVLMFPQRGICRFFRPYIDWRMSARVLDNRRLGKQRVEAKQVMNAILRRMGLIRDGRRGLAQPPNNLNVLQ